MVTADDAPCKPHWADLWNVFMPPPPGRGMLEGKRRNQPSQTFSLFEKEAAALGCLFFALLHLFPDLAPHFYRQDCVARLDELLRTVCVFSPSVSSSVSLLTWGPCLCIHAKGHCCGMLGLFPVFLWGPLIECGCFFVFVLTVREGRVGDV